MIIYNARSRHARAIRNARRSIFCLRHFSSRVNHALRLAAIRPDIRDTPLKQPRQIIFVDTDRNVSYWRNSRAVSFSAPNMHHGCVTNRERNYTPKKRAGKEERRSTKLFRPRAIWWPAGRHVREIEGWTMWLRSFDLVRLTLTLSSDNSSEDRPGRRAPKTHPHPEAHPDALSVCVRACVCPSRSAMWNDLHSRHVSRRPRERRLSRAVAETSRPIVAD